MSTEHNLENPVATPSQVDGPRWTTPRQVLRDPGMTRDEKRALLASWASDARAVANYPALRQLDTGHLVTIDDVLGALEELDGCEEPRLFRASEARPKRRGSKVRALWGHRPSDDDDDDPLSPAPALVWPRPPVLDGAVVEAA